MLKKMLFWLFEKNLDLNVWVNTKIMERQMRKMR